MTEELSLFIEKIKGKGSVLGLSNMKHLMEALGNVQNALPIIHIAGTNGKGSVGTYLSYLYQKEGLSVGRYTSPAVFSPMEIYTINGIPMEESIYLELMEQIRVVCKNFEEDEYPTIFEAETAIAFLWFEKIRPDVVLLECGMGGETDATNVIEKPLASVITSISRDHVRMLGDTVEEIAGVKAGIIKPECPVFSAPQQTSVEAVIQEAANLYHANVTFVKKDHLSLQEEAPGRMVFTYHRSNLQLGLETKMAGHYQMENAALALEVYFGIRIGNRNETLDLHLVMEAIADAVWPGRFEVVHRNPLVILDGAHNEGAMEELAKTIEGCFGNQKLTLVLGVLADKDHKRMLSLLLPYASHVITITPQDNPRAMSGLALASEAMQLYTDIDVAYAKSYKEALQLAIQNQQPILACGSLSYLGGFRKEVEALWN